MNFEYLSPESILIIIVCVFCGCIALLSWYRNKETQDLSEIELKIFAAEHDIKFREDGRFYSAELKHFELFPHIGADYEIENVMTCLHEDFHTYVFDVTTTGANTLSGLLSMLGMGNSKDIHLIGIAIEFENIVIPRFEINVAEDDVFTCFEDKIKIKNKLLPDYLKNDFAVFQLPESSAQEIVDLLVKRIDIHKFLLRSGFNLLAGSNNILVYYQSSTTRLTVPLYNEIEEQAIRLGEIFSLSPHSGDIKSLKGKT